MNLSIFTCTWNVGANVPTKPVQQLSGIFRNNTKCQLVVVALQEMVELKTKNLMMSTTSKHNTQKIWQDAIHENIGIKDYFHIHSENLVGI